MSTPPSFGKIEFHFAPAPAGLGRRPEKAEPFRLAVIGDFSGRSNRGLNEPIDRGRIFPVDCDNFEEVTSRLKATLRLPAQWEPSTSFELQFATVDDFHPDRVLSQVKPLRALLEKRQRLLDPSTSHEAATELQSLLGIQPGAVPDTLAPATSTESTEETLARLLGGAPPPSAPPRPSGPGFDINQLIRKMVAPSVVPAASPEQTALLSTLELELTHQLRAILHHPEFQALESAWRGVDLLVRQFGAEENVKLYLIDVSKEELAADLRAHDELTGSQICKTLRAQSESDEAPWAVLIGHYVFRASTGDLQTLGRMARISALLNAPFLAGAAPEFVGCDSFHLHPQPEEWNRPLSAEARETWAALRGLPEASYLGLALPRFLLRQPYGKQSDPIDAFPFAELAPDAPHESFQWGNPAILCACVLADAFQAEGWEMQAGGSGEVGDMPVHKFSENGETKVKPCAEAWLSERAGDAILGHGLVPLLSIKGRDAVRLASLRSVSDLATALSGRWY